jgi:hypothetical protein
MVTEHAASLQFAVLTHFFLPWLTWLLHSCSLLIHKKYMIQHKPRGR